MKTPYHLKQSINYSVIEDVFIRKRFLWLKNKVLDCYLKSPQDGLKFYLTERSHSPVLLTGIGLSCLFISQPTRAFPIHYLMGTLVECLYLLLLAQSFHGFSFQTVLGDYHCPLSNFWDGSALLFVSWFWVWDAWRSGLRMLQCRHPTI